MKARSTRRAAALDGPERSDAHDGSWTARRLTEIAADGHDANDAGAFEEEPRAATETVASVTPPKKARGEDAANAAAPMSRDSLRLYFQQMGRVALLTREGEIELAQRIEMGEHAILRAILQCDEGIDAIAKLGQRLKSGEDRARDVVRASDDEDPEWADLAREKLLKLVAIVLKAARAPKPKPTRGAKGASAGDDRAVTAFAEMGLNKRATTQLVDEIRKRLRAAERDAKTGRPNAASRAALTKLRGACEVSAAADGCELPRPPATRPGGAAGAAGATAAGAVDGGSGGSPGAACTDPAHTSATTPTRAARARLIRSPGDEGRRWRRSCRAACR